MIKPFNDIVVPECSLDTSKVLNIYNELLPLENVEGALGEVGVYKGGTAVVMRRVYPDRPFHLYDTFTGIVGAIPGVDVHLNGDFGDACLDKVQKLLSENSIYHVGIFPSTFSEWDVKFAFVHSDTDTYMGTKESLIHFAPRIAVGGKLVFDDYEWKGCPGVKKAVDEWLTTYAIENWKISKYEYQIVFQRI